MHPYTPITRCVLIEAFYCSFVNTTAYSINTVDISSCWKKHLFDERLYSYIWMHLICRFEYLQGKFQAFYQYAKSFNSDDFDYEELKNSDFVFMRWKVQYV